MMFPENETHISECFNTWWTFLKMWAQMKTNYIVL
jgi:hypothetical protein